MHNSGLTNFANQTVSPMGSCWSHLMSGGSSQAYCIHSIKCLLQTGFFNLSQITLYCGAFSVHYMMFSIYNGLYSVDVSFCTYNNQKYSQALPNVPWEVQSLCSRRQSPWTISSSSRKQSQLQHYPPPPAHSLPTNVNCLGSSQLILEILSYTVTVSAVSLSAYRWWG